MLPGFCSDSHDHLENIRKVVTLFKKEGVHQVKEIEIGNTLSINPGSLNGFDEKGTVAICDTERKTVQIKAIDEK